MNMDMIASIIKLYLRNHLLDTLSLHPYMYHNTCGQMVKIANLLIIVAPTLTLRGFHAAFGYHICLLIGAFSMLYASGCLI